MAGALKDTGSQLTPNGQANEVFMKQYNKELKVQQDEIPLVLLELNESALVYI